MPAMRDGDRIVVIDRKLSRDENTRIFIGVVEEYDDGVVRARGFAFNPGLYEVAGTERHGEERVRVVSLAAGDVCYLLPRDLDIGALQLKRSPKSLALSNGASVLLDLSEWIPRG